MLVGRVGEPFDAAAIDAVLAIMTSSSGVPMKSDWLTSLCCQPESLPAASRPTFTRCSVSGR